MKRVYGDSRNAEKQVFKTSWLIGLVYTKIKLEKRSFQEKKKNVTFNAIKTSAYDHCFHVRKRTEHEFFPFAGDEHPNVMLVLC